MDSLSFLAGWPQPIRRRVRWIAIVFGERPLWRWLDGRQLLGFFESDSTAKPWFLKASR